MKQLSTKLLLLTVYIFSATFCFSQETEINENPVFIGGEGEKLTNSGYFTIWGPYYIYIHSLEKDLIRDTHYIALMGGFSNISLSGIFICILHLSSTM